VFTFGNNNEGTITMYLQETTGLQMLS